MNKEIVSQALESVFGAPKCPECRSDARRPKCFFEWGQGCPRHDVIDLWQAMNMSAREYTELTESIKDE